MAQDYPDEQVASTFRQLNGRQNDRQSSRMGIYASWAALALLAACFFFVAVFLIDADRQAESVKLQQASDLAVQSVESRLLGTTELMQKTSMRLMHVPGVKTRVASSEMAALGLMQDRREVLEMALVSKDYAVLRHWVSPSQSNFVTRTLGNAAESPETRAAIDSVLHQDASLITPPYTLGGAQVFVNLYVPTPSADQALVARINLTRLISEAALSDDTSYVFYLEKNGTPLVDRQKYRKSPNTLSYATTIPMLNDPTLRFIALSNEHSLFTTANVKLWSILALAALLALSLALLLKYQRQQHKAHQMLSAEYALRAAMSESALAGIRVTDRMGRILFVNDTFQKLVGHSFDELVGMLPPYPYWEDDMSDVIGDILSHPEEHHVRTIEFRVRRSDGVIFDAQLNVSPLLSESRAVIGWMGELYDITEQKRARERMRAAHERFTRVVQSMNSAICVISTDADDPKLLFSNAPYQRIFGSDADGAVRLVKALTERPALISRDGIFDEVTGRWFDARMQWLTWTDDMPARMLIATDITNQRETELALEAQVKRAETTQRLVTMGEMASSLAHELNQPLAAIANYASGASVMIQAGKLSREDTVAALGKVTKQAQRAAAIIKRIRGFAAAKKTDPQFLPVVPETIVSETMELALIQADKLKARIRTLIDPGLPPMTGDAVMLEQLLLNLLKNAMEAVQGCEDRTVELRVHLHDSGHFIQFDVADRGPGISDEAKPMLFDAFYSTKNEGMGMGLNICRSIVEIHQGRITITDTPGGGATFSFTVPLAKQ